MLLLSINLAHHPIAAAAVAPLLLCFRFCCSIVAAVAPTVATLSLKLSLLLSLHCHSCGRSAVALLFLRYHYVISPPLLHCCSASTAVSPAVVHAIAPAITPLLLLGLFTVVASRGRIRVMVPLVTATSREKGGTMRARTQARAHPSKS